MGARRWRPWTWAGVGSSLVFFGLLWLGTSSSASPLQGSLAATTLAGVLPLVDPLVALEVSLAGGRAMAQVLVRAALLLGAAALLGPVFCGWACPLGRSLELVRTLRRALLRGRAEPTLSRHPKYALLAGLLAFALTTGTPLFAAWSPIQGVARGLLFGGGASLSALAVLAAAEARWPGLWCRSLCPLGALYGLVSRRALLRVRVDPKTAGQVRCRRCEVACPMGIRVMQDYTLVGRTSIDHPDCTRCGACTEVCPMRVLRLGLRDLPQDASNRAAAPDALP